MPDWQRPSRIFAGSMQQTSSLAMAEVMRPGMLVLVVGPSGAGKDSLLAAAQSALAGSSDHVFPVRDVTRPAGAAGEAHNPVTTEEFHRRRDAGAYALHWEANGHGYGIPAAIAVALAGGQTVLCNVSRGVIDLARQHFARVAVIWVTAPPAVLASRIVGRGRETTEEIAARLARLPPAAPAGPNVAIIDNGGDLQVAAAKFVAAVRAAAA